MRAWETLTSSASAERLEEPSCLLAAAFGADPWSCSSIVHQRLVLSDFCRGKERWRSCNPRRSGACLLKQRLAHGQQVLSRPLNFVRSALGGKPRQGHWPEQQRFELLDGNLSNGNRHLFFHSVSTSNATTNCLPDIFTTPVKIFPVRSGSLAWNCAWPF